MPRYYLFNGERARNEEIAQVKNMMPILTISGRGYWEGGGGSCANRGGVSANMKLGTNFMKRGKEAYEFDHNENNNNNNKQIHLLTPFN